MNGDDEPEETLPTEEEEDGVQNSSDLGTVGSHPPFEVRPFRVAPTLAQDFNVLSLDVPTVACVSMNDVLFAFDSSFLTPSAAAILKDLPGLREKHKNRKGELPPVSVFGHADPVGNDDYNKALSGRRARAVYGLLINDAAIWEDLFKSPSGGDDWGAKGATKTMGDATGKPTSTPRKELISSYMKTLFPAKLDKSDFLGRGAAANGKADFQGCSEFNPLRLLSKNEGTTLPQSERDSLNEANRRVVIFLYCPGRKVNPQAWPCPAANEGIAGCKARFFSDGEKRRTPAQDSRREFAKTRDTFACRFYDRMARVSPCEGPVPPSLFGVRPIVLLAAAVPVPVLEEAAPAKAPEAVAAPTPPKPVIPTIGATRGVVIVKKPHTRPSRVAVVLKTDTAFSGTGEFTAAPADTIQFFASAKGGTPIQFNGKQNVFPGKALSKGVTLFAQGAKPSGALNDVTISLNLKGGAKKINNNPATAKLTSVEVQLSIHKVRTSAAADPAALSEAEKITPGRAIHVQRNNKLSRAIVVVQKAKPAAFTGKLVLTPITAHVKLFPNEKFTAGESAQATPVELDNAAIAAAGKRFFVEGATVSSKVKDTGFLLGIKDVDPDGDRVNITVIEAKLDILKSRVKAGTDGDPLSDADKLAKGRPVHLQDAARSKHRATLVVHQVKPADFKGKLVLTTVNAKVSLMTAEAPKAGDAGVATMELDHGAKYPSKGEKRFLEGAALSAALVDTGVKLGVKDVEDECDRIAATVFQVEKVEVKLRSTPCRRNGSLATTMPLKSFNADSKTFDATAFTVVRQCGDVEMEATVKPAAMVLAWDIQRASDDDSSQKGEPTHAANGSDKKRKVTADATGSFHVFAFVDTNGNNKRNGDEDGLTVNLNMVEIKVKPGAANNRIVVNPTYSNARSNAASLVVDSGTSQGTFTLGAIGASYTDAEFVKHAIGFKAVVTLTGGGANLRRGVDKVTLGYNQVTTADSVVGTYADGRREREAIFVLPVPPANIGPGGQVVSNPAPPAAPHPELAFPVRDTRGPSTTGTGIFIISSTDNDKKNLAKGEERTCRFIDPPAIVIDMRHPVTGAALASIAGSNDFEAFLLAFSSDWNENFVAITRGTWSTTYGTFTAAGGWTNAGAAVTAAAAMTVLSPPSRGEDIAMERCPPNFVDNLLMDAR